MSFHYLDTRYAISANESTSEYFFPIEIDPSHDKIALYQCEIAKSMYNVATGSNTFLLDATPHTLNPGNYTLRYMLQQLNLIAGLTVTFNSVTGKLTFSGAFTTLSFPMTSSLYFAFGFNYQSTNNFAAGVLTSENVINLQINSTCNLHCTLCRNDTYGHASDLLHRLEIASVSDYSVYQFQNEQLLQTCKPLVHNRTMQIKLTNAHEQPINLNGLGFNCVLYTFSSRSEQTRILEKMFSLLYNSIDRLFLENKNIT